MINKHEMPFYIKMSQLIVGIFVLFYIIDISQGILVPLVFALIIAILLNPFVNFLQRWLNRILSISIAVILASIFILAFLFFIGSQASMLGDSLPELRLRFSELLSNIIQWAADTFDISTVQINTWIAQTRNEGLNSTTGMIGQTLSTLSGVLVIIFLIPVYIFLFLFYKPLLLNFIAKVFPVGNHEAVLDVLNVTKTLIQSYLLGLMLELVMVTTLYITSLLLLGIEYALLLGFIGGLLNLIPYIGRLIAVSLPLILALATKPPVYTLYIFIAYAVIKFIDNTFIGPLIVASKVKINALVSIVVVLVGGAIWGVAGMFLSLPLTAIIKVIFDRIVLLKPFGFLLGDTMPPIGENIFVFRKSIHKK